MQSFLKTKSTLGPKNPLFVTLKTPLTPIQFATSSPKIKHTQSQNATDAPTITKRFRDIPAKGPLIGVSGNFEEYGDGPLKPIDCGCCNQSLVREKEME
jgi:hypothetical protein